ncbi:hypothetical protein K469DRAFT_804856, partial [Zopfia rhizophila CBS 207.26]
LKPLKEATSRLKSREASSRFSAIYKYGSVEFNKADALEDHLVINVRAGWNKL